MIKKSAVRSRGALLNKHILFYAVEYCTLAVILIGVQHTSYAAPAPAPAVVGSPQDALIRELETKIAGRRASFIPSNESIVKLFETGFNSTDSHLRETTISALSQMRGPDFILLARLYEKALLSPHDEVKNSAEALLVHLPEPGHKTISDFLLKSTHERVRQTALNPYKQEDLVEWIKWIEGLPVILHKAGTTSTCDNCTARSSITSVEDPSSDKHKGLPPLPTQPTVSTSQPIVSQPIAKDDSVTAEQKLVADRYNHLMDLYKEEIIYREGLHYLLNNKVFDKTLAEEFYNKKMYDPSEYQFVNHALNLIDEIEIESRFLISKLEPTFSVATKDKESILKMEKALTEHLSTTRLQKNYQEYISQLKDFQKITNRVEGTPEGKKILKTREQNQASEVTERLKENKIFATPSSLIMTPFQRWFKYELHLKDIIGKKDQKLDGENIDALNALKNSFIDTSKQINHIEKLKDERAAEAAAVAAKPEKEKNKYKFWKK